jgi:hypothetical protein
MDGAIKSAGPGGRKPVSWIEEPTTIRQTLARRALNGKVCLFPIVKAQRRD